MSEFLVIATVSTLVGALIYLLLGTVRAALAYGRGASDCQQYRGAAIAPQEGISGPASVRRAPFCYPALTPLCWHRKV